MGADLFGGEVATFPLGKAIVIAYCLHTAAIQGFVLPGGPREPLSDPVQPRTRRAPSGAVPAGEREGCRSPRAGPCRAAPSASGPLTPATRQENQVLPVPDPQDRQEVDDGPADVLPEPAEVVSERGIAEEPVRQLVRPSGVIGLVVLLQVLVEGGCVDVVRER